MTGDYIISPCYDGESKVDNYFVIYSLSQGEYLNTFYADLPGDDEKKEIESLCEIEPGKIMLGVGISNQEESAFMWQRCVQLMTSLHRQKTERSVPVRRRWRAEPTIR